MAKCGKVRWPTKTAALKAARKIPPTPSGLVVVRAYRCGKCKAWHLTSKPG
jgi:hypothetical protein